MRRFAVTLAVLLLFPFAAAPDDDDDDERPRRNPSSAKPPPAAQAGDPAPPAEEPAAAEWEIPAWFAPRFPAAEEEKPKRPVVRRPFAAKLYDENRVAEGLKWLANHQEPDGLWDCDGFQKQCKLNLCDGAGYALYDVGVTGLALLAFLADGQTRQAGTHAEVVGNGLQWLVSQQDPEGCFGGRVTNHFTYNHAIATLALAEAYGMTGSAALKTPAQKAVDFIAKCQNPYLAWRYGERPGDNDTSVSAWMISALKSARAAGLRVGTEGFEGMTAWLDKVTEPEYGRVGYTARGTSPARAEDLMDKFPADKSESLTGAGMFCRVLLGQYPGQSEMIQKGAELCVKLLPAWDEPSGTIDMCYWYWGTLAMFQVGNEAWDEWRGAMKIAALDHQRRDGDEKGSWDPLGPYGRDGGRVYSTALMTVTLLAEKRYPRMERPKGSRGGFWRRPVTR